jgi:hypothetical protein
MRFHKHDLLKSGVYIEQIKHLPRIIRLIQRLHPIKTEHALVRFGSQHDGGYLIPDDLAGINICFSPGVEANASFEMDIFNQKGIISHLTDYSVESPPTGCQPASFTKKYLGCLDDEKFITLNTWVGEQAQSVSDEDFLLQMDIEGAEYLTLLGVSEAVLKKFRIMVVEIHHVEAWASAAFFEIVETFFNKLLKHFYVVHNHPNNNEKIINIGGVEAPSVFELSLIRKDRVKKIDYCLQFPHALDRPNIPTKPDIVLPRNWFLHARIPPNR